MNDVARLALAVCVMLTVWIMWSLITDFPGANFGTRAHLLGVLAGPMFGLVVFIGTGK